MGFIERFATKKLLMAFLGMVMSLIGGYVSPETVEALNEFLIKIIGIYIGGQTAVDVGLAIKGVKKV